MEEAEGPELTVEALTARVLGCNFVAIHVRALICYLFPPDSCICPRCGY